MPSRLLTIFKYIMLAEFVLTFTSSMISGRLWCKVWQYTKPSCSWSSALKQLRVHRHCYSVAMVLYMLVWGLRLSGDVHCSLLADSMRAFCCYKTLSWCSQRDQSILHSRMHTKNRLQQNTTPLLLYTKVFIAWCEVTGWKSLLRNYSCYLWSKSQESKKNIIFASRPIYALQGQDMLCILHLL